MRRTGRRVEFVSIMLVSVSGVGFVNIGQYQVSCDHIILSCHVILNRWPVIATMVKFRAAVGDAPVSNFWSSPDKEQIAYARDGKGFVAINNDQDEMDVELQTSLPEGSYCDLINLGEHLIVM